MTSKIARSSKSWTRWTLGIVATVVAVLIVTRAPVEAADPDALWRVVDGLCVTDMRIRHAPAPCMVVDLQAHYAVLKDLRGATQLLLIPTDRVSGIESPKLLAPDAPNYWQDAWDARGLFEQRAKRPVSRDELGLAINSVNGRSQNQLHIHIDCVRPDVRAALSRNIDKIGYTWTDLDVDLAGERYRARRLDGETFGDHDPFKLLAADPVARADMARETLVAVGVGAPGEKPGFVLLSGRTDLDAGDRGAGEDLLDHSCAVLNG